MGQKACNSPHFIFWLGKKDLQFQNKFWGKLNKIVENSWLNINYVGLGTNSTKVYINGEDTNLAGSGVYNITRTRNTNTADIAIGTRAATSGSATSAPQTDGFISSVHVYGRALSANEVKQNFEAVKGRFGL